MSHWKKVLSIQAVCHIAHSQILSQNVQKILVKMVRKCEYLPTLRSFLLPRTTQWKTSQFQKVLNIWKNWLGKFFQCYFCPNLIIGVHDIWTHYQIPYKKAVIKAIGIQMRLQKMVLAPLWHFSKNIKNIKLQTSKLIWYNLLVSFRRFFWYKILFS